MTWFVDKLSNTSTITQVIVSVSVIMSVGFLMTRLTKLAKLPNVTGYILAGILIGPYCLNLIPQNIISGMGFISDIALAFIAFSVGEFFKFDSLKKSGLKIIVLTIFEALMASIVVFIVMYFVLGLSLPFSIVLAALASATAPASTVMTIRQTKAKGDFVDTLLQVVAIDDVVSLIAYSVAISVALASVSGAGGFSFNVVVLPILKNLLMLVIGAAMGYLLKLLMQVKHGSDNRLIIVISVLLLFCGISSLFDVSPLLGCMIIGTVYINLTKDEKLFLQVNYFSPPILLMFFVVSGLSFNLSALFSGESIIGSIPLWAIGVIYFFVRIIGKYLGAYLGCLTIKKPKEVRNYLGLALIPQAGVAIGLAALGARTLGGDVGSALQTIILASSVLYELVGPVCAKLSLYLSKSYSTKIEDVVPVEEVTPQGEKKSQVDLLIERIHEIERQNATEPTVSQEEQAFTEASEEALEALYNDIRKQRNRRGRF
ncbi:MAG: cation:proton antiporter [Eubacteriales bacterium]|nr:cation:proton antiporter [Eubacteriales bacterium]